MKRISVLAAMLVLTLLALTGCGCRNSKPMATTLPTTLPTIETDPTTASTTTATTETASYPTMKKKLATAPSPRTARLAQSKARIVISRAAAVGSAATEMVFSTTVPAAATAYPAVSPVDRPGQMPRST